MLFVRVARVVFFSKLLALDTEIKNIKTMLDMMISFILRIFPPILYIPYMRKVFHLTGKKNSTEMILFGLAFTPNVSIKYLLKNWIRFFFNENVKKFLFHSLITFFFYWKTFFFLNTKRKLTQEIIKITANIR